MPAAATGRIDEVVKQPKASPNGAYIEVEGYTDNRGDKAYNEKLGLDRAESGAVPSSCGKSACAVLMLLARLAAPRRWA